MSSGHTKSFRLKRNNSDPESNNDTKKKHNHTLSNLFRRKDKKDSLTKSQSVRVGQRNSLDINALNATKPKSRMGKSISVPDDLSLNSPLNKHKTFTINGEEMDLSKVPPLPPMSTLQTSNSKREEFEAVRRKLIGNSINKNHSDESDDDLDDDEIEYEDEEYLEDGSLSSNKNKNYNKKHHEFLHLPSNKQINRSIKSTLTLPNITHDQSDSSLTKDESENSLTTHDHSNSENSSPTNQRNGLFSTLMNTLNLRSFTDLANNAETPNDDENGTDVDDNTISSSISSNTNHSSKHDVVDAVDAVKFVPVKKSLISTLGQGSLTLDAFPKNQTQLLTDNKHLSIPNTTTNDNNNTINNNISNNSNSPHNEPMTVSASDGAYFDKKNQNLNQENTKLIPITSRSRTSKSPMPRKQTIRNSLSSIISEEDNNERNISALPMSNSISFKKKLKLPIPSNRKSLDSVASITRYNSNSHPGVEDFGSNIVDSKKKEMLFDQLDLKPPSDKRQESFHSLFSSLPSSEILIEDFACAYRKEILVQGRLYLSEHHISFHSNIIGLVTRLTIPLNAILKIQKKRTVGIPNAIEFSNLHNKYIFATFMSRDPAYELICKVWKANVNNEGFDTIDLDLDEVDSIDSISNGESDDDDDGVDHHVSRGKKDANANDHNNDDDTSVTSVSDQDDMIKDSGDKTDKEDDEDKSNTPSDSDNIFNGLSFEGPKTHTSTSNGYTAESSDTKIIEDNIPAPVGLVFDLLFGDDNTFVKNLLKAQKNYDIGEVPKFTGNKRTYRYTKPVNGGPVGPKQTKCIVEEIIDHKDFNKNCLVLQITESPDVPSGNAFKVKTKMFLSWGPNNSTTLLVVTTIVWTGKSWIKGAIEKGAISGQKEAMGILISELKKKILSGGSLSSSPSKVKKKEKARKHSKEESTPTVIDEPVETVIPISEPEPKGYLDLIIDQFDLKLFLIIVLFAIVITERFKSSKNSHGYELYSNNRMLMSESSLWEWIEQRELVTGINTQVENLDSNKKARHRMRFKEPLEKAGKQKMSQQELKDTIDMMELQLKKLKEREISHSNII